MSLASRPHTKTKNNFPSKLHDGQDTPVRRYHIPWAEDEFTFATAFPVLDKLKRSQTVTENNTPPTRRSVNLATWVF